MNSKKTYKGRYKLKNPGKYKGNPTEVIYRSLWERKLCVYFDTNPNIISWSIEPFPIPYLNPIDQKMHRYWVDFWIQIKNKDGKLIEKLIEVKPFHQTQPPKKKDKITKTYINEVETWIINNKKWEAAKKLCENKQWDFVIITEKNLFKDRKNI